MADHVLIDPNVLVRHITGDPPELAAKALRLIEAADHGDVVIEVLPTILAEIIYTLESFYEMERKAVAKALSLFLRCRGIWPHEKERRLDAFDKWGQFLIMHYSCLSCAAVPACGSDGSACTFPAGPRSTTR